MANNKMASILGENLLNELLFDPVEFTDSRFKGYDLLNEYLKGFDIETLIPALLKDDQLIFRIAISIASELSQENCSVLLPYLIPILNIEEDPLYIDYLLNAIFKGTYNDNHREFSYLLNQLNSQSCEVQSSTMHLISVANNSQIIESFLHLKKKQDKNDLVEGLSYLIKTKELDKISINKLLNSQKTVLQLFGAIIAKKLFCKYPEFIQIASISPNQCLREFAQEVIEIEKDYDI